MLKYMPGELSSISGLRVFLIADLCSEAWFPGGSFKYKAEVWARDADDPWELLKKTVVGLSLLSFWIFGLTKFTLCRRMELPSLPSLREI